MVGSCFQAICTMSPWSVMNTGFLRIWWNTSVLLAWPRGDRCRWMRMWDLEAFSASRRARLATGDGASRTRWRS
jgi:hypothetical protein